MHGTPIYCEDGNVYFINGNNLVDGKIVISAETKKVNESQQSTADKSLDDTTILMSINGTIGNLAYYSGERLMLGKSAAYIKVSEFDKRFVYAYLQAPSVQEYFMDSLTGTTIKNLGLKAIREMIMFIPQDVDEQKRIGKFLDYLDHLITLHQRKYDKLVVIKKSMLEKMFPKNGQTKPEIRFSGFTDDWEQRKLGEYVSIISGEAPSKFEEGTELYVKVDDLNYNDKYVVDTQNKVAEHSTVKRVTKGSVVFPKRGAAIMTNKVRIIGIDSYMDTNMMALTSEKLDSEFLYNIISKEGLYKIADTSTIPQINNKHVEPYEVTIPSLDEQRRIGAYFKQLDHLITLHQRELEKLKKIKLSMLEKMFV